VSPLGSDELERFLQAEGLEAEILPLDVETPTVDSAAAAMGVDPDQIVKTLVFLQAGRPVLVIASGRAQIRPALLAEHLGADASEVALASPKVVLAQTGYEVGGVPPFGHIHPIRTIIDPGVLEQTWVYAGGGTARTLLRVSTADLMRVTKAEIHDLRGRPPGLGGNS
jgi:prolyl-tRNA editing enzyme YbaK/EbsC (Cys-tRNA(Pro) deacylase)